MQRAVIYCRVSTKDQTKNLSLPTQEKACREYCIREGYEVVAVFVEEGESAKTADGPDSKNYSPSAIRRKTVSMFLLLIL
jgi:site-specific DNA recombinase